MIEWEYITRLMKCFPHSFINQYGEFIAHRETNAYFKIDNCKSELDIKCKVLEWLSRDAYKAEPFRARRKNEEYRAFIMDGINRYLGTSFTDEQMETIYTYLGNACNHEKTIRFIESGFDMFLLAEDKA